MPQPLTPGHTATVKIKALTEQEAAAPGGALSLLLLAFQPSAGRLHACSSSGPLLPIACDQVHISLCLVMEMFGHGSWLPHAFALCPQPLLYIVIGWLHVNSRNHGSQIHSLVYLVSISADTLLSGGVKPLVTHQTSWLLHIALHTCNWEPAVVSASIVLV